MKFRLYKEYGALNSVEVFNSIETGLLRNGHEIVNTGDGIPVIWSVLWHGRMANNQKIYEDAISQGKPILIIEVGNLKRNKTWRLSLNHINSHGDFANQENLDYDRPKKIGVSLNPYQLKRRGEILIATQHERSLQWAGMPTMKKWTEDCINEIKKYTSRRIIIRPHPRNPFTLKIPNTILENPKKITNTYDDYDIFYNYHCVVNHNSGPAVQALIRGVPIICDKSSLAGDFSNTFQNIDNLQFPNRDEWFLKLCHTEWTIEEISQGIPINRLVTRIEQNKI